MDNPKRKPGRPRVTGRKPSEGQPILSARVGRDMYTAAVELAAAEKITLANWVRNALIGRIVMKQGKPSLADMCRAQECHAIAAQIQKECVVIAMEEIKDRDCTGRDVLQLAADYAQKANETNDADNPKSAEYAQKVVGFVGIYLLSYASITMEERGDSGLVKFMGKVEAELANMVKQ